MEGKSSHPSSWMRIVLLVVVWISPIGVATAQNRYDYEMPGIADEPRGALVRFDGKNWQIFSNPRPGGADATWDYCSSPLRPGANPTWPNAPKPNATEQWAALNDFILVELGKIIESRREAAIWQAARDRSPPKWWRDLLATYVAVVSYTPFDRWQRYLRIIDWGYSTAGKRVFCFTTGDRGGWVLDSASMKAGQRHVVFFSMGTNTREQMDANTGFLPYHRSLHQVLDDYKQHYRDWLSRRGLTSSSMPPGTGRFCPALTDLEWRMNVRRGSGDDDSYVFKAPFDENLSVSLAALRGIRTACMYRQYPDKPWGDYDYNPISGFFSDIQDAHVTFAGHSRGGIGEGLAAFVAVHEASQSIRSIRVVGLATPAASNLWRYEFWGWNRLPNGREFSRIVIQNQSSVTAGLGADQVPRMGSEGGIVVDQQLKKRAGWAAGYGQQPVRYLYDWATELAEREDPAAPRDTMLERRSGGSLYLSLAYTETRDFAALALPHWAGVYAAGIIGQHHWENGRVGAMQPYWTFLAGLASFQQGAFKRMQFRSESWWRNLWRGRRVLTDLEWNNPQVLRRAMEATPFTDTEDGPNGSRDEGGSLWTVFYMSEAAMAATQFDRGRALPDGYLPVAVRYAEGWDNGRTIESVAPGTPGAIYDDVTGSWYVYSNDFRFVDIGHLVTYCEKVRKPGCQRWAMPVSERMNIYPEPFPPRPPKP